jgi:RNA polymerase sigma factor (sigma-70 family)
MPTPTRSLSDRLIAPLRRLAARDLPQTDAQLLGTFVRHRDPAAFEALVRRHGPMVYGVCRRVVAHAPDADDAFQAVFVVLARRAGAVRPREKLADFLFGVAYRTALKARARLTRRRTREKQVDAMPDVAAPSPDTWSDLQPVIDQELAALPDTLRLPVLLCDLEGRTQREAAAHLKLPPATLATRLASARRKLAERLSARGITLAGGAVAAVLTANAAKAVPSALVGLASGSALAAVGLGSGVVPANVLELSDGVLRMIATNKLKVLTAVLAAVGLLAGGGSVGLVRAADPPAAKGKIGPTLDDRQFLTKSCEMLRGSPPTPAEMAYFLADKDETKRKKVVTWLTEPEAKAVLVDPLTLNTVQRFQNSDAVRQWDVQRGVNTARLADEWVVGGERLRLDARTLKLSDMAEVVLMGDETKSPPPVTVEGRLVEAYDATYELTAGVRVPDETDEQFLSRVIESARGGKPTRIEKEYYLADKDAKKREKLLDQLLKDPAVAKKVGPEWKQTMLNPPQRYSFVVMFDRGTDWADKLIDDLLAKKKSDDQVLEALTLATTGRLPTDTEKKLAAAVVAKQKEKKAGWQEVAGTLAGTDEAKKHADRLKPQANYLEVHQQRLKWSGEPRQTKPVEPKK